MYRNRFINDVIASRITKDGYKFKELAEMYGYPEENGANLCKKDYYKALEARITPLELPSSNQSDTNEDNLGNDLGFQQLDGFKATSVKLDSSGKISQAWYKAEEDSISKLNIDDIKSELFKAVTPTKTNKAVKSDKTLMLWLGDAHIGMAIDNDAPISSKVLSFTDTLTKSLQLVDQDFKEVVVMYGGDMIDSLYNNTSRGGHYLPSSMNQREMFEEFISGSKKFFTDLANHPNVGKVAFYSVSEDNHTGTLNGVFSRALELWLNAALPDITTKVFDQNIDKIERDGHTFIVFHGKDGLNQIKGLPLVLTPVAESYINRWCLVNKHIPDYRNTHVVKFDLHQSSYQVGQFFSYLNCLSMQTGSKWQQSNFMSSCPGITYSIISNNGILNSNFYL